MTFSLEAWSLSRQPLVGDGEFGHECLERQPLQWQHEQQPQGQCEPGALCPVTELSFS